MSTRTAFYLGVLQGLLLVIAMVVLDCHFSSAVQITTTVVGKDYVPAHPAQTSHGMVYQVAPEFRIAVAVDGDRHWLPVDEKFYGRLQLGSAVSVNYLKERIFGLDLNMKIKPPNSEGVE